MSTTHHHRPTTSEARQRAHQRDLLHLLANRDLLVQTIRDVPFTDDEDAVGYLHLLAAVEAEIEEHFPDIYARELPHWLLAETGGYGHRDSPSSVPALPRGTATQKEHPRLTHGCRHPNRVAAAAVPPPAMASLRCTETCVR